MRASWSVTSRCSPGWRGKPEDDDASLGGNPNEARDHEGSTLGDEIVADVLKHAGEVSGNASQETPWMTTREGAAWARVGVKLIYREIAAKRLRHARVGGRRDIRLKAEWISQWLEASAAPVEVRP